MSHSGKQLTFFIQEFLDTRAKQDGFLQQSNDICLTAFEVAIVRSWVNLPRVIALIHNEATKQTILFIFAGTRITDTVMSYLTTDKLIAVDKAFNCKSDPIKPTTLQITGRDFSLSKAKSVISDATLSNNNMICSQKSHTAPHSDIAIAQEKARFCTLSLVFDNITSVDQFRTELAFELSRQSTYSPLPNTNTDWLDKYRVDIAQKWSVTSSHNLTLSHSNGVPRAARSFSDLTHAETASAGVPFSSASCSSTSSESRYDSADEKIDGFSNVISGDDIRRVVSVPRLMKEEKDGEIEKGHDVVIELANSDCISTDYSETTLSTPITNTNSAINDEQRGISAAIDSIEAMTVEKNDQRSTRITFMSDATFRARMNADLIVRSKLEENEAAYCSWKTLHLFIGSWNVNGRQDSLLRLDPWIHPPAGQPPVDIFVFGFQELDLNLAGMALNKQTASPLESKWLWLLEASMESLLKPSTMRSPTRRRWTKRVGDGFKRLSIVRLAGLLLVVYVSNRLFHHAAVSDISVQSVPTGMFNLMGNKGAVGLRLTVYNHSICFLNCHLAAGSGNCERRNQDYREILRKMMFERRGPNESTQFLHIDDHDQIFLFGDLNYRVAGLDVNQILAAIARKHFSQLLRFDELVSNQAQRRVLHGFKEGKITFPPTYKFDLITKSYYIADGRAPSYCDRILWKGKSVELLRYQSHDQFCLSDHKPVSAYFKIGARCVCHQLFMRAYEAIIRSQDLFYNMLLPQAALSSQEVDFGPIRFEDIQTRGIRLTNTGHSVLEFAFTQEGAAAFPLWLRASPPNARVEKGQICDISLEICVGPDTVAAVQSGMSPLSCIIVLTLVGGKDFFISITGRFIPTSFGLPLTLLLRLPTTPVSLLPLDQLTQCIRESQAGKCGHASFSRSSGFAIPKEVYRLSDYIAARFNEPNLFRQPEMRSDLPTIRDILDTTSHDVPIPSTVSVHSVIYSLLVFLSTLPEPVVPFSYQSACLSAARQSGANNVSVAYQAISRLPFDCLNLFLYLVSFIKSCLSYRDDNGTNSEMLASTFSDILLRDPPYASSPSQTALGLRNNSTKQQQIVLCHHELKTIFLRIFINSDTEEVIRLLKRA